jgi:uncharacterized membrane protein (DUF2068 family)
MRVSSEMSVNTSRTELKLPSSFKGKYIGVLLLTIVQGFVGIIHAVFGLVLVGSSSLLIAYGVYTFLYGTLTTVFAYGLGKGKPWSWMGTIAISIIVVIIDVLTVLDLPIIPDVPKFAATGEIPYSIAVIIYLIQPRIRNVYTEKKP